MRVPTVYLKMMDKARQKVADSFNEGTFWLSLTQLDSKYTIEVRSSVLDISCTVVSYDR